MQFISNVKTMRRNTKEDMKDFKSQTLAMQAKKREISFFGACY